MHEEILEIISRRSNPGIAIFSLDGRLLYINNEALSMTNPEKIFENFKELSINIKNKEKSRVKDNFLIIEDYAGAISARAYPIGVSEKAEPTHIIVLLEKIARRREIDIEKAKKYNLTKREIEIVSLISQGLSNKKIAKSLSISENTVKDHIKNIAEKMNVRSRGEIIALLK